MRRLLLCLACLVLAAPAWAAPAVLMKTSLGEITIELEESKAPLTVKNFLGYVEAKAYDGTIFHRVIPGFMIQGGGFDADLKQRETRPPIKNEAANGLKNRRGTIAMARTNVVDSATSQFFINLVDNGNLDHRSADPRGFGYAVFGRVTAGMDVVDRIARVTTRRASPMFQDLPAEPVVIHSIRLREE